MKEILVFVVIRKVVHKIKEWAHCNRSRKVVGTKRSWGAVKISPEDIFEGQRTFRVGEGEVLLVLLQKFF